MVPVTVSGGEVTAGATRVLHLFKERPDEIVRKIIEEQRRYAEIIEFRLYERPVDYDRLIELVEKVDKVFTW